MLLCISHSRVLDLYQQLLHTNYSYEKKTITEFHPRFMSACIKLVEKKTAAAFSSLNPPFSPRLPPTPFTAFCFILQFSLIPQKGFSKRIYLALFPWCLLLLSAAGFNGGKLQRLQSHHVQIFLKFQILTRIKKKKFNA